MRHPESNGPSPTLRRVAWLILPVLTAGLGHVAVIKRNLLPPLARPLDRDRLWRGQPLLGPNKTWRGLLVMTALTGLITQLQAWIAPPSQSSWAAPPRYPLPPWLSGALVGLTYSLAELPNSLVKRRLGIAPGRTLGALQYAGDQLDSVVGCLVALRLLYRLSTRELSLAFALGAGLHVAVDAIMYPLGVKHR